MICTTRLPSLACLTCFVACIGLGCDNNDGNGDSAGNEETSTTTGGTPASETTESTDPSSESGSTGEEEETTAAPGSETGPGCAPVIGEYAQCRPTAEQTDTSLCNYQGMGGQTGFLSCLTTDMDMSTCFIGGCESECDCFAQPATGTAVSACRENVTADGESGCVLDCSGGATCPDGMECANDICFWPLN